MVSTIKDAHLLIAAHPFLCVEASNFRTPLHLRFVCIVGLLCATISIGLAADSERVPADLRRQEYIDAFRVAPEEIDGLFRRLSTGQLLRVVKTSEHEDGGILVMEATVDWAGKKIRISEKVTKGPKLEGVEKQNQEDGFQELIVSASDGAFRRRGAAEPWAETFPLPGFFEKKCDQLLRDLIPERNGELTRLTREATIGVKVAEKGGNPEQIIAKRQELSILRNISKVGGHYIRDGVEYSWTLMGGFFTAFQGRAAAGEKVSWKSEIGYGSIRIPTSQEISRSIKKEILERVNGSGVPSFGFEPLLEKGRLKVGRKAFASPADLAGIVPGDEILEVNGKPVGIMNQETFERQVDMLRAIPDAEFTLLSASGKRRKVHLQKAASDARLLLEPRMAK